MDQLQIFLGSMHVADVWRDVNGRYGFIVGQIMGQQGTTEFIRRLVVSVATGNGDAHLKNWSLLYPDGRTPTFAPLYDQVATIEYAGLAVAPAMRLGHARHFHEVSTASFLAMQKRWRKLARPYEDWWDVPVVDIVDETLEVLRCAFDPGLLGVQPVLLERLVEHWRRVPLLRRHPIP